jgi:hypothetical protein
MRCWQHSYAVAALLNTLLRERDPEQESMNHLIGLCHDLGEILLRQHIADEYSQIVAFASTNHLPLHQVESVALGVRHPELVSRLLARIGLPTPAVQGIREFYERQIRDQAAGLSARTQALTWANLAAHGLLLAASTHETVRPITRVEWGQFSASKAPPELDPVFQRNDILATTNVLARLPEQEERRLLTPPIAPTEKHVWYLRPDSFIAFDPLAFALRLCCNVTIAASLPSDEAWSEIDSLIVVGIRAGIRDAVPSELARKASAAGRANMPILCLVAEESAVSAEENVLLRSYPISLDDLGNWLAHGCAD